MTILHKKVDKKDFKITLEELDAFKFIATFWDKTDCLEEDRQVWEFETYGGAMECCFDLLELHLAFKDISNTK